MSRPDMTYAPAYYNQHDRVVAAFPYAASLGGQTPPQTYTHPIPSSPSPIGQPPPARHSTYSHRLSQNSSPGPGASMSGSSISSKPFPVAAMDRASRTSPERQVPLNDTYMLSPNTERGSFHSASRQKAHSYTDEEERPETGRNKGALLVLLSLSLPVPIFSLLGALYTLCTVLILLILSPLQFCAPSAFFKTSTATQLCTCLVPALHIHHRLILSQPYQETRARSYRSSHSSQLRNLHNISDPAPDTTYSTLWSIVVLMLCPLLSIPTVIMVWIAAFFWVFTKIMGNPDGTENSDDGRAAVLGVRNFWRAWLRKAVKRTER